VIRLLTASLLAASLWAQVSSGSLTGYVSDEHSQPVQGATISVVSTATGAARQTLTDQRGDWRLYDLLPGEVSISVRKSRFRTASIGQVRVVLNQKVRLNFQLASGSESDTVNDQHGFGSSDR
jgi:hypothetical protein